MTDEKEKILIDKYSYMFAEYRNSIDILKQRSELSKKIQNAIEKNDDELFKRLNEDINKIPPFEPIAFGFEHNDGWYDLLDNLMKEIETIDINKQVNIVQIKEKFGTLRFYIYIINYDNNTDKDLSNKIYNIIAKYENLTEKTCEVCGKPGVLCTTGGWLKTVCINHRTINYDREYKPVQHFHGGELIIWNNEVCKVLSSTYMPYNGKKDYDIILDNNTILWQNDDNIKFPPSKSLWVNANVSYNSYPTLNYIVNEVFDYTLENGWTYRINNKEDPTEIYICKETDLTYIYLKNK